MYINRTLLLLLGIAFIFYPSIEEWLAGGNFPWYRIYQFWLLVVLAVYWNQRSRYTDEL
jgi:hypothetical protein